MNIAVSCLLASSLAAPCSALAPRLSDDPGAAWIKANAIPFTTPEAGNGFAELDKLGAVVGDARIVSLGEPTHGTREAFQMKHRLLEYLVEKKGFSIFSIEANMPESYKLNEYVIDGKGDPKALIGGMYFWTWNTEEVLAMVEWMRAWNQKNAPATGKPRLQFTGFDMQTPDVAHGIVQEFIKHHAPELAGKNASLLAEIKGLAESGGAGAVTGWTSATGNFPAEPARGKKLTLRSWVRTAGVTGYAAAWCRGDVETGQPSFGTMQGENISGDTEWTRHEFTIDIANEIRNIVFGFILNGDGTAWFDDVEILLDGKPYEDPKAFSFDFENDAVRFLMGGSREYAISRSQTRPHGGKKCLEIRKREEAPAAAKPDPAVVLANAEGVVTDLLAKRADLIKASTPKETDWAIQNARVVAQCAAMFADPAGMFNKRDESMAANVRWILEHNPGQKIVLWAHNGHVSHGSYMGMKSMGTNLKETHAKEMVVFAFATGTGTYTAMAQGEGLKSDLRLVAPMAGSIEEIFTQSGLPMALVDIRKASKDDPATAWAATSRQMRSIGAIGTDAQFYPCVPAEMYDVLVWQEKTTASRPLK